MPSNEASETTPGSAPEPRLRPRVEESQQRHPVGLLQWRRLRILGVSGKMRDVLALRRTSGACSMGSPIATASCSGGPPPCCTGPGDITSATTSRCAVEVPRLQPAARSGYHMRLRRDGQQQDGHSRIWACMGRASSNCHGWIHGKRPPQCPWVHTFRFTKGSCDGPVRRRQTGCNHEGLVARHLMSSALSSAVEVLSDSSSCVAVGR